MSRERELLLALAEYVLRAGHEATCTYHTNTSGKNACSCGYRAVQRAAEYFTRNNPI